MTGPERRAQLAANLAAVQRRIDAACAAAGRPREQVRLVVVTKTFPASDAALLRDLGVTELGENRDQEAAAKAAAVPDVRWHFVGQLQTNKARSVARYAALVHSLDRPALVEAMDKGAERAGRTVEALVQVSLDGDRRRGGAPADEVMALADQVAASPYLRLRGVMAVAPPAQDPAAVFARLALLAERVRGQHALATEISAGMSGDLEQAVAAGATLVRVGSAVLGVRPAVLG